MTTNDKVQINLYAAARDAVGQSQLEVDPNSIAEVFIALAGGDLHASQVLSRCSVLVNGERIDDLQFVLRGGEQMDVLPPFAGG